MADKLPKRRTQMVRDLLYDNWTPVDTAGYDPSLDLSNSDALLLTTDWSSFGSSYPAIVVSNGDGNVIGEGETQYTGAQGDGTGVNQHRQATTRVTVRAEKGVSYNNDNDAQQIVKILTDEIEDIVQADYSGTTYTETQSFGMTPFAMTLVETSSGTSVRQAQGQVSFVWNKEA